MERRVTGFHQDEEKHWVAELECGHNQHVRHDPPWECRPWVVTPEGRRSRLGITLNCVKCDRGEPSDRAGDTAAPARTSPIPASSAVMPSRHGPAAPAPPTRPRHLGV